MVGKLWTSDLNRITGYISHISFQILKYSLADTWIDPVSISCFHERFSNQPSYIGSGTNSYTHIGRLIWNVPVTKTFISLLKAKHLNLSHMLQVSSTNLWDASKNIIVLAITHMMYFCSLNPRSWYFKCWVEFPSLAIRWCWLQSCPLRSFKYNFPCKAFS